MKLLSLKYENTEQEWEIAETRFFDLTLLVGVSGVGKTQILKSIHSLKHLTKGDSKNGAKWEVHFVTLASNNYVWKGQFENIKQKDDLAAEFDLELESDKVKPKIIYEQIIQNDGRVIVQRDGSGFIFNGKEMPKLTSNASAVNILKEEDVIKEIYDSFQLMILRDHTQKEGIRFSHLSMEKLKLKYPTYEQIKESDLDTFNKLALVYDVSKEKFEEIQCRFIEVFPQVESIKIEPIKDSELSNFIFEATVIQIKEKGVQKWIPHYRMSSGMLRTLLHIAEMYLWNEGTVILIDEFENSLGLNCIDVLTEDLVYDDNKIQFIATSHHPYIINKIPFDCWKIVTRKGSLITAFDAKDYDLGESHHDRFMSLINHPFYREGIS